MRRVVVTGSSSGVRATIAIVSRADTVPCLRRLAALSRPAKSPPMHPYSPEAAAIIGPELLIRRGA